jgi:hypothetical protein
MSATSSGFLTQPIFRRGVIVAMLDTACRPGEILSLQHLLAKPTLQ